MEEKDDGAKDGQSPEETRKTKDRQSREEMRKRDRLLQTLKAYKK